MKKPTIFIFLFVILGACGFTFYSIYNNQQSTESAISPFLTSNTGSTSVSQATVPNVINEKPVNKLTEITEQVDDNCLSKADLLSNFSSPGLGFDNLYSRFRVRPTSDLRIETASNDSHVLSLINESDLDRRTNLKCFHKDKLSYQVYFNPDKRQVVPNTNEGKLVTVVNLSNDEIVQIYYPTPFDEGYYVAYRDIPGGYITYFINELDRSETEAVEILTSLIKAVEVKEFSDIISEPEFSFETLIYQEFPGQYTQLLYETSDKLWVVPNHEKDGCARLYLLEKVAGTYTDTQGICLDDLPFEKTKPLYLSDVTEGLNLETGKRISIFDAQKSLDKDETLIARCFEGDFGQRCITDYKIEGTNLIVSIYRELHKPQLNGDDFDLTQPPEFDNEKLREITIDLSEFY